MAFKNKRKRSLLGIFYIERKTNDFVPGTSGPFLPTVTVGQCDQAM